EEDALADGEEVDRLFAGGGGEAVARADVGLVGGELVGLDGERDAEERGGFVGDARCAQALFGLAAADGDPAPLIGGGEQSSAQLEAGLGAARAARVVEMGWREGGVGELLDELECAGGVAEGADGARAAHGND